MFSAIMSLLQLFFNRVYKKVAIVSSAVFVLIAVLVAVWYVSYARQNYLDELKRKVTEFAVVGADQSREMFVDRRRVQWGRGFFETTQFFAGKTTAATVSSTGSDANQCRRGKPKN